MKKFLYFIIFMVLVAGVFYYLINNQKNNVEVEKKLDTKATDLPKTALPKLAEKNKNDETKLVKETSSPKSLVFSDGSEVENIAPDILVIQVDYSGKEYFPSQVNIKVGDVVIFKNNSTTNMWPASNEHPDHLIYPEFDSKKSIEAGGRWQFVFNKAGKWYYHDHLNPSVKGVIIVE